MAGAHDDELKTWASCTECRRETAHDVLHQAERHDVTPDGEIHVRRCYSIIQCRGCETLSFEETYSCSEDFDEDGEPFVRVTLYPSRTAGRQAIDASTDFPLKVHRMYLETLQALNVNAPVLATVGMRALVEAICLDRGCTQWKLEDKIGALVEQGVLAPKQAEFLNVHWFLGNDAAHDMRPPPSTEIIAALDILENLLRTIYELPHIAAGLTASREQRRLEKQSGLSSTSITAASLPVQIRDAPSGLGNKG